MHRTDDFGVPDSSMSIGDQNVHFQCGTATDVGRLRSINEDAVLAAPPIFLVADGMGGHQAGDIASSIVVEEFSRSVATGAVTPNWILQCFARADARIRSDCDGGGTTVAGAAVVSQADSIYWLIFNCGDSRIYHRQDGQLRQKSVDHSIVQELLDSGELSVEDARFHPQRHVITRAVGLAERANPDFWLIPAAEGDRLVMCSDGLSGELSADSIAELGNSDDGPAVVARALVDAAVAAGGRDNVSVVIVDIVRLTKDSELLAQLGAGPIKGNLGENERTLPRLSRVAP